jgi:hypothetical protein
MPNRSSRPADRALALLLLLLLFWAIPLTAAGAVTVLAGRGDRFNIVQWEVTRLAEAAATRGAGLFRPRAASNADLLRFQGLIAAADDLRRDPHSRAPSVLAYGGGKSADQLAAEAERLRPAVEARVGAAIAAEAGRMGLRQRLPLFTGVSFVWPPVLTGLSVPPHILIISPRNRIEETGATLLRTDLSAADAARIEQQAEQRPNTSALVDQIGGLGAYPPIVDERDTLRSLFQTAAHEWTHDYLAFHPLGVRYAASGDMTLINETVANLVGAELGGAAYASLGLPAPPAATAPAANPGGAPPLDFNTTLHTLRLQVDDLLAAGKIDEAEQQMNATAALLRANGYNIRRINQAYFAFYGSYGDSPAASNPLGVAVQQLRRAEPNLADFLHAVQNVRQPGDVTRLLSHGS